MQRTYLFARLWTGFLKDFPAHEFDAVADDDLQLCLDMIGADWIRKNSGLAESTLVMRWAAAIHEATKDIELQITEGFYDAVGVPCLIAKELGEGRFEAPRWSVVHASPDAASAEELRDALNEHMPRAMPVRFRIESQHVLGVTRSLVLERDLERLHSYILDSGVLRAPRFLLRISDLQRVAVEAIRFAKLREKLDPRSPTVEHRTPPVPPTDAPHGSDSGSAPGPKAPPTAEPEDLAALALLVAVASLMVQVLEFTLTVGSKLREARRDSRSRANGLELAPPWGLRAGATRKGQRREPVRPDGPRELAMRPAHRRSAGPRRRVGTLLY